MGSEPWPQNPAWIVPEPYRELVRLWALCRRPEGGYAGWPDPGGLNDQPAWLVDAFRQLGGTAALWDEERRKRGQP